MIIAVPILIERAEGLHTIRPLFNSTPAETSRDLGRGTARFVRKLREVLDTLGKEHRHEALARYAFAPRLHAREMTLTLYLKRKTARLRILLVWFTKLGRRIAFTPSIPDVWFGIDRGQDLLDRASEVLTDHFRRLERDADSENLVEPEECGLAGKAWLTTIEVECSPRADLELQEVPDHPFASLGREEPIDGAEELSSVGRCLDTLYPGELNRAFGRAREVEALKRSLNADAARPTVILGPSKVGKTTIVHEHVFETLERRGGQFALNQRTWAIAPQRLISGMSYVGQWEERLLAILKEAEKRQHVLYFDDYVGLYRAGVTANSTLSVGHVLKPFIQRGQVRILAEATPETWRVLRELDRGVVDLFEVVRVEEPSRQAYLRMLVGLIRELEVRHDCRFASDVLPVVIDLTRRYARHLAFPGKAATLLSRLAIKHAGQVIDRDATLDAFHAKSGLSVRFLDDRKKLLRAEVTDAIGQRIIGQRHAVDAMADVVGVAKAQLNDPTRPLASFLFIGPTGVGKTECAKALAAYLFGDASRLLRFDMNEFVDATAAGRLVGTFGKPDGLLTSAIRRTPFAVVLLDEIEKADPDVFDLLLQLLDDGRLTDALGRTADFSAAIVVLTSNLGVLEANRRLGFGAVRDSASAVYRRVAERFFRPELFNRIDRLVAFEPLGRRDMRRIAEKVIDDVLSREGLARRRCLLDVDEGVLDRVAKEGYHPELGARAMKRTVERTITRRVAGPLAAILPDQPAVLHMSDVRGELTIDIERLDHAQPLPGRLTTAPSWGAIETVDRISRLLDRIEARIEPLRPQGAFGADDLAPEHQFYFEVRERLDALAASLEQTRERADTKPNLRGARVSGLHARRAPAGKLRELIGARDFRDALDEVLAGSAETTEPSNTDALVREAAYLDALVAAGPSGAHEQVRVAIKRLGAAPGDLGFDDATHVLRALESGFGIERTESDGDEHVLEGPLARQVLSLEEGVHLVWMSKGTFATFRLQLLGGARRPPTIVRIYERSGTVLDVRSESVLQKLDDFDAEHRSIVLSQLPAPFELMEPASK